MNIDDSWMKTSKKLTENITTKHSKEIMKTIDINYIYIDSKLFIKQIITKKHDLDDNSLISKDKILQIIINNEIFEKIKYKSSDILLYNVNLESEVIQSYLNNNDVSIDFLKSQPFYKEIIIPSSLFIFHNINSLYIIYQEVDNIIKNNKTKKMKFKCKHLHTRKFNLK